MQVPRRHHARHADGRLIALALAFASVLVAGCTTPQGELEASSVEDGLRGSILLTSGFSVLDVRLTAAPRDADALGTPEAPVELAPDALATTAIERDHWVFEAKLREDSPGTGEGSHRVLLEWNGKLLPAIHVAQRGWGSDPEGAVLRFDLGPQLESSSLYVLTVRPT